MATASYQSTRSQTRFLDEKSYPSLLDIPPEIQKTIEIVDVFRPAEDVPPIMEQAIKLKQKNGKPFVVWMQLGIVNEEAAEAGRRAGLIVVMDRCLMVEHHRLASEVKATNGKLLLLHSAYEEEACVYMISSRAF